MRTHPTLNNAFEGIRAVDREGTGRNGISDHLILLNFLLVLLSDNNHQMDYSVPNSGSALRGAGAKGSRYWLTLTRKVSQVRAAAASFGISLHLI